MDDLSEKIRARIMKDAYDLADRNYNTVKAMCSDVLELLPRREWVGLTEEEVDNFVSALWPVGVKAGKLLRAIEAKLREKNGG